MPNKAGDAYDWIGFDPRGVGSSKPSLSCDRTTSGPARPLYEPVTQRSRRSGSPLQAYATACGKTGGALLGT